MTSSLRRGFDWCFRSREDGRIVIGQFPNLSLGIFLVAAGIRRFLQPAGMVGTVVSGVATAAAIWWAADELLRGVNPWRRFLGAVVLSVTLYGALMAAFG